MFFIDDLQWADPSTLALLHYMSRNLRESKVLIVCTYRHEDLVPSADGRPHIFASTMQLMSREDLITKIELKSLEKEE